MANRKQIYVKRFVGNVSNEVENNAYEGGGEVYEDLVVNCVDCDPEEVETYLPTQLTIDKTYDEILKTFVHGKKVTFVYKGTTPNTTTELVFAGVTGKKRYDFTTREENEAAAFDEHYQVFYLAVLN